MQGPVSRQYTNAPELWNPSAAGAIRPDSGKPWDYQAGIYNPDLAAQLKSVADQGEHWGSATAVVAEGGIPPRLGSAGGPEQRAGTAGSARGAAAAATASVSAVAAVAASKQQQQQQRLHWMRTKEGKYQIQPNHEEGGAEVRGLGRTDMDFSTLAAVYQRRQAQQAGGATGSYQALVAAMGAQAMAAALNGSNPLGPQAQQHPGSGSAAAAGSGGQGGSGAAAAAPGGGTTPAAASNMLNSLRNILSEVTEPQREPSASPRLYATGSSGAGPAGAGAASRHPGLQPGVLPWAQERGGPLLVFESSLGTSSKMKDLLNDARQTKNELYRNEKVLMPLQHKRKTRQRAGV